mmetsp:Transcript_7192/g.17990  ORF Transcript_7192/g.17990 Transcript_7192/m.17990 type:complete len:112 (-) Transcript_7192:1351-1686(-)
MDGFSRLGRKHSHTAFITGTPDPTDMRVTLKETLVVSNTITVLSARAPSIDTARGFGGIATELITFLNEINRCLCARCLNGRTYSCEAATHNNDGGFTMPGETVFSELSLF